VQNPVVEAAKSSKAPQEETDVSTDDETSQTAHVALDPTEEESEASCEERSTTSISSARAPVIADDECSPRTFVSGSSEVASTESFCTPVTVLQDLLRYHSLANDLPPELEGFVACAVSSTSHASTCQSSDPVDRSIFGTQMQPSRGEKSRRGKQQSQSQGQLQVRAQVQPQEQILTPSAGAYRPRLAASKSASCEIDLKRTVQSRLNKVCPENVDIIAQQLCDIEITSSEDLQLVISLISKRPCVSLTTVRPTQTWFLLGRQLPLSLLQTGKGNP